MRESVIYVNNQFKNWVHPQTKERVDILDLGGQTTLGGFYIWKLNDSDKKKYKSEWGGFCVGTIFSYYYFFVIVIFVKVLVTHLLITFPLIMEVFTRLCLKIMAKYVKLLNSK